jgi:hypothetical protein
MKFRAELAFITVLAMLALPRLVQASDDPVPASPAQTQAAAAPKPQTTTESSGAAATTPSASQPNAPEEPRRKTAEEILEEEKKQTMLGIVPITGMTNYQYAPALTPGQKFNLMIRNYATPFPYLAAGFQAGISQAANNFEGYGQGAAGYGKRFGSALADGFNSGFFSNYFYPVLFKQDPRYFRFGSGYAKKRRMWSVLEQEFVTKKDSDRSPVFSYSNVLGALTAGSISNAYYPQEERGFGLTMSRTAVSFGWGMVGNFVLEFWPDISGRLFHKKTSDVTVK